MSDTNNDEKSEDQFLEGVEIEEEEPDVAKFDIFSYPADITLSGYYDLWEDDDLLIPKFQRNYIWDVKRASKLIESFLLGLPVPPVFLYLEKNNEMYSLIDGQQRIISIISFISGKFIKGDHENKTFTLKGLNNPEWNNKSFEDLSEKDKAQFKKSTLRSIVIRQMNENDNRSIHYIFERLNTGGMVLNAMEVRLSLSFGDFADTLKKLNELPLWRQLIKKDKTDKRFRDIEWILRAIALHDNLLNYDSNIKGFLNDYMSVHKNENKEWLDNKVLLFENALEKASLLADNPFHIKERLNLTAMDSILIALMSIDGQSIDEEKLKDAYKELIQENSDYYDSVTTGKTTNQKTQVKRRIELAKEKFGSING